MIAVFYSGSLSLKYSRYFPQGLRRRLTLSFQSTRILFIHSVVRPRINGGVFRSLSIFHHNIAIILLFIDLVADFTLLRRRYYVMIISLILILSFRVLGSVEG